MVKMMTVFWGDFFLFVWHRLTLWAIQVIYTKANLLAEHSGIGCKTKYKCRKTWSQTPPSASHEIKKNT